MWKKVIVEVILVFGVILAIMGVPTEAKNTMYTKKAIDTINSGEVLEVLATDKGALNDFKAWASAGGHTIIEQTEEAGVLRFLIQKA